MFLFKIIGIGIVGTILSLLVKQYKPEVAIAVPVLTGVVILSFCIPYLSELFRMFESIAEQAGIEHYHLKIVIKIIGVAYICQFASDICRDAGETAIASKIELGGKVTIITLSMPIMYNLLIIVSKIINFQ